MAEKNRVMFSSSSSLKKSVNEDFKVPIKKKSGKNGMNKTRKEINKDYYETKRVEKVVSPLEILNNILKEKEKGLK